MKRLRKLLLALLGACPLAFAQQGPITTPQLNTTYYVKQVAGFYPTIQSAVTKACGATGAVVDIPVGSTPSDTVGAVTGGCTTVTIEDDRALPRACYTWSGSAYTSTQCYGSNGGVTQVLPGPGIGVSPSGGIGNVTITNTAAAGCPLQNLYNLCMDGSAPYYAYGIQPTITQTTGTFGVGTGGTVASCANIHPGDPITINGAGIQGALFVGAVSTCSGTALVLTTSTSTSVAAGAYVLAYPAGTTTTTTFGVGTSGQIASCAQFTIPGQGVYIAGAGTSGTNYIGTLVSCTGTALVVTPPTSTSVASGTAVSPDNTAAILAAYTTAYNLGWAKLNFPPGLFPVRGPLLDTSGANAVLPVPKIPNYEQPSPMYIGMFGAVKGPTGFGSILQFSNASGNSIGGKDTATGDGEGPFTFVWMDIEDMVLTSSVNDPGSVLWNCQFIVNCSYRDIQISAATSGAPANTAGAALILPALGDQVRCEGDGTFVEGGFYHGIEVGEHCNLASVHMAASHDCLTLGVPNSITFPGYNGNTMTIQNFWALDCANYIANNGIPVVTNIAAADFEHTPGCPECVDVNNTGGYIMGVINYNKTFPPHCGAITVGANNGLLLNPLECMQPIGSAGPPSGLLENWASTEGTGSTLNNTGSDSTNSATATNVTWGTAVGFTGNVALYNGTSSVSVASSFADTNFDGTTPFSACSWFNTSASTTQILMSTLSSGAGVPGWRMDVLPTRNPEVYLISNIGTGNYINVQGSISAGDQHPGIPHLACFTYDGSKRAAGVIVYSDGQASNSTVTDGLTGSIASGVAVHIGGEAPADNWFSGALIRNRIFNRVLTPYEIQTMYLAGPCIGATCAY